MMLRCNQGKFQTITLLAAFFLLTLSLISHEKEHLVYDLLLKPSFKTSKTKICLNDLLSLRQKAVDQNSIKSLSEMCMRIPQGKTKISRHVILKKVKAMGLHPRQILGSQVSIIGNHNSIKPLLWLDQYQPSSVSETTNSLRTAKDDVAYTVSLNQYGIIINQKAILLESKLVGEIQNYRLVQSGRKIKAITLKNQRAKWFLGSN